MKLLWIKYNKIQLIKKLILNPYVNFTRNLPKSPGFSRKSLTKSYSVLTSFLMKKKQNYFFIFYITLKSEIVLEKL